MIDPSAGYRDSSQPITHLPRQHRPQLRHRVGRLRPRHQIVDLPNPPPIQKRLRRPHHRHPNPVEPPPRKRRPNLTLQPRTPRPPRHQRLPIPERPPVLQHPEFRMHRRPAHRQVDRRLVHPLNPKEGPKVRQPPHPRFRPNLPTRKLHPPHGLEDLRNCNTWLNYRLRQPDAVKPSWLSGAVREVDGGEGKETTEVWTRRRGAEALGSCLPIC